MQIASAMIVVPTGRVIDLGDVTLHTAIPARMQTAKRWLLWRPEPGEPGKKDKDLLQAISILREVCTRPALLAKARAYLRTLPKTRIRQIRTNIAKHLPDCEL